MPDSARYLHPEAIRRIARLELRARHIVEGFLSGMHRSPWFGHSVEFLQHRQYVPGDELRDVDWRVWARQDRLYVKQYEEDTNMRCHLLVDASASMAFGNGPLDKYACAATVAATLAWLILRQQDAVGAIIFDSAVRCRVPVRSRRRHLITIAEALESASGGGKTGLYRVLQQAAATFPRRGLTVLVSDLFSDVAETLKGLRLLQGRGHDVMVVHILDDEEIDFGLEGATRFESLESDRQLRCNPRALRDGYLEALQDFLAQVRHGCANLGVDYVLVRTSDPLDAVLPRFLNNRLGMRGRNRRA
jgi:uncharacterized protein (DUF58 family)